MNKTILKKKIIGLLFIFIILFSLAFSMSTPNSVAIGDNFLRQMGMKAWSNETNGFHITGIYSLLMLIIGYMGLSRALRDVYPSFVKRMPIIMLVTLLIFPSIYSSTYSSINRRIMAASNGVKAIDYNRQLSKCEYHTDSNGNLVIDANLQFQNFSGSNAKFYVKILPDDFIKDNIGIYEPIISTDAETNNSKQFTLPPKAMENLEVHFKTPLKNVKSLKVSMQNPNIIIFNGEEKKEFILD